MTVYLSIWLFGWAQFSDINDLCDNKPDIAMAWTDKPRWLFKIEAKCEPCRVKNSITYDGGNFNENNAVWVVPSCQGKASITIEEVKCKREQPEPKWVLEGVEKP